MRIAIVAAHLLILVDGRRQQSHYQKVQINQPSDLIVVGNCLPILITVITVIKNVHLDVKIQSCLGSLASQNLFQNHYQMQKTM